MQAQLLRIQVLILRAQQIDIAACGLFGRLFSATAGKRNLLGIQGQIFCKTGQGDRCRLLQQRAGDALRSQLLLGLFIQLPLCGIGNNDLRTGAQPAVMARLLAAKTDVVTIIGTGLQGYMSLLCMSKVLDMKEIRVCDISEAAMDRFIARFIARFPDAPFRFVKCKSNEEGCRGSDVIITVTNANADLVEEPWVKPGALVMTMGSFRETSFDVVRKADRIAVDQVGQSLHRGNVKELAEMGEITADSFDIIVPDVLAGKMPGRTDPNHRIYAQIIGTGMLDVALAGVLLEKLHAAGAQPPVFDMMGE